MKTQEKKQALDTEKLNSVYDRAARRYDSQHSFLTANSDRRGRVLLVERAVISGDRVLDLGAGTGSTGLLAARKTGATGRVVLFDASRGMLAVAQEKAAHHRIEDRMEIRRGDMIDLPFEDASFDVVLSTCSMCPISNPARAAREARRVTRPGGRIGIAHSTDPDSPAVRWLADRIENLVWHIPSLSLGCRSVDVLPALEQLGCRIAFRKRIGVPLWPFLVFVAEKRAPE